LVRLAVKLGWARVKILRFNINIRVLTDSGVTRGMFKSPEQQKNSVK